MGISFERRGWIALGIRWLMLGIPWVCQDQVPWACLALVQVWVLQILFLYGGVGPTRVGQGLFRMGGYWGGILEVRVVMAVRRLLGAPVQGVVWLFVGLWVV